MTSFKLGNGVVIMYTKYVSTHRRHRARVDTVKESQRHLAAEAAGHQRDANTTAIHREDGDGVVMVARDAFPKIKPGDKALKIPECNKVYICQSEIETVNSSSS